MADVPPCPVCRSRSAIRERGQWLCDTCTTFYEGTASEQARFTTEHRRWLAMLEDRATRGT